MARPLISAVLLMLLVVSPALGADEDLTQIVVPYGDLDLHSASGQTEMHARLVNAASTLCRPRGGVEPVPDATDTLKPRGLN